MFSSAFPESLVNDVVPYIEKNFRVIANKDSRAIAGLSMGGGHTLTATNAHPDVFSYVGVFSMGTAADVSDKLRALKKAGVKFYYVGHGKDDPVVRVAQGQNLAAQLQKVALTPITRRAAAATRGPTGESTCANSPCRCLDRRAMCVHRYWRPRHWGDFAPRSTPGRARA